MLGLSLHRVTKAFNSVLAVRDLTLGVKPGELLALLGPSGSGKTTVLRLIAGLERPDRGSIVIEGKVMVDAERGVWVPPERRNVGVVFQDYALFPHMTALQNVAFAGCFFETKTSRSFSAASIRFETLSAASSREISSYFFFLRNPKPITLNCWAG